MNDLTLYEMDEEGLLSIFPAEAIFDVLRAWLAGSGSFCMPGTKRKKDDAWEAIAVVFNSSDGVSTRSAKQLRAWWKNSKARTKKEVTAKRRSFRKTGGGSPSSPLSSEAAKVSSIVPSQLTALNNPFDCDGDEEEDIFLTPPTHPPVVETSSKRKCQQSAKDPVPKRKTFSLKLRAPSTSAAALQSITVDDSAPVSTPTNLPSRQDEATNIRIVTCNTKPTQQKSKNPPKEARSTLLAFEEEEHCIRLETLQMESKTAARLKEKADFEFDAVKKEHALRMELMQAQLQNLKAPPTTWTAADQSSYSSSNYYQPNYHSL